MQNYFNSPYLPKAPDYSSWTEMRQNILSKILGQDLVKKNQQSDVTQALDQILQDQRGGNSSELARLATLRAKEQSNANTYNQGYNQNPTWDPAYPSNPDYMAGWNSAGSSGATGN